MQKNYHPKDQFYQLEPQEVLSFLEGLSYQPTGQVYQLNSYENRVFDVFMEDGSRVVTKFYRPKRWSAKTILEEHNFCFELKKSGFPVVAPLSFDGSSLFDWDGLFACVFPRAQGRMPDELTLSDLNYLGGHLARLHNIGSKKTAKNRLVLGPKDYLSKYKEILGPHISPEISTRYFMAAEKLITYLYENLNPKSFIRLQGDCHKGNLLYFDDDFCFLDFDDFCMGPAIQDFWMLTYSPDKEEREENLDALIYGYEKLRIWNEKELLLIEPLRALRIVSYACWIAKRWDDPNFPKLFPNFQTYSYWAEEIEAVEKIVWELE